MPVPCKTWKQVSPSEAKVAGAASDFWAKSCKFALVNRRWDRHTVVFWPDSVVCTAATNGTLLG